MKEVASYPSVTSFHVLNNGAVVFIDREGGLCLADGSGGVKKRHPSDKYYSIQLICELLVVYNNVSKTSDVYTVGLDPVASIDYLIRGKCDCQNGKAFVYLSKGAEKYIAVFLERDGIVHELKPLVPSDQLRVIIGENAAIGYSTESICLEQIDIGKCVWQLEFPAITGKASVVSTGPIVTHDQILLTLKVSEHVHNPTYFLIGLDLHTGEVITPPTPFSVHVYRDGDYAYGVNAHNHLYTYHIPTGEVMVHDLSGLMADHSFFVFDRVQMVGSKLYFTHRIGAHHAKAGILDYEKKEMLWKYDFDADEGSIGTLKVIDGYVYFHMQDKTLHVFKED